MRQSFILPFASKSDRCACLNSPPLVVPSNDYWCSNELLNDGDRAGLGQKTSISGILLHFSISQSGVKVQSQKDMAPNNCHRDSQPLLLTQTGGASERVYG